VNACDHAGLKAEYKHRTGIGSRKCGAGGAASFLAEFGYNRMSSVNVSKRTIITWSALKFVSRMIGEFFLL
jgi:hypothetical protein